MMSESEHGMVEWWIAPPPPIPRIRARPRAGVSAEHVPPHDRCADISGGLLDDTVAVVHLAPGLAVRLAPEAKREDPLVQPHAAHAEWVIDALVRAGDETVERHRDPESQLRHSSLLA